MDAVRNEGYGYSANADGTTAYIAALATKPAFLESLSSAGANALASLPETSVNFYRGASTDYNAGFIARGVTHYPDASYDQSGASTGTRIWGLVLTSNPTSMMGADRGGAYHFAGFNRCSVNGGAADTNWQFVTGNGSTQTVVDTTLAFAVAKTFDFQIACPAGSTTIYWRVRNLTDATSQSGTATGTLPGATTALGLAAIVRTINATARKQHVAYLFCGADRC